MSTQKVSIELKQCNNDNTNCANNDSNSLQHPVEIQLLHPTL